MIRICGDLHLRKEEPFFSAAKSVLEVFKHDCNRGDTLIFAGDFFHTSRPFPEELKVAREFFHEMNLDGVRVIILAGNHEYLHTRGTYAEDMFVDSDITFISEPTLMKIDDEDILFLPWISSYDLNKKYGKTELKDFYEEYLTNLDVSSALNVVYHFEDESCFMGPTEVGVDLSILESKCHLRRIGGHIHIADKNYIGVPYATRKDETGQNYKYIAIGFGSTIEEIYFPEYISFQTISYEELKQTRFRSSTSYILEVVDAPSSDVVYDLIHSKPNLYLSDYTLRANQEREVFEDNSALETIKDYMRAYVKINKVDEKTTDYLLSLV